VTVNAEVLPQGTKRSTPNFDRKSFFTNFVNASIRQFDSAAAPFGILPPGNGVFHCCIAIQRCGEEANGSIRAGHALVLVTAVAVPASEGSHNLCSRHHLHKLMINGL
jgi:hypothetical protein